jgi:hypothetical protein
MQNIVRMHIAAEHRCPWYGIRFVLALILFCLEHLNHGMLFIFSGRIFERKFIQLPIVQILDPIATNNAVECANLCLVFPVCRSFSWARNGTGLFCSFIKLNRRQVMAVPVNGYARNQLREIGVYFTKIYLSPPWGWCEVCIAWKRGLTGHRV